MAQAERADMLAYLIEMAFLEAGEAASGARAGGVARRGEKPGLEARGLNVSMPKNGRTS